MKLKFYKEPEVGEPKLYVAIGRRHGTAVKRNRIKRQIKEAFRLNKKNLPAGRYLIKPTLVIKNTSFSEFLAGFREFSEAIGKEDCLDEATAVRFN